MHVTIDVSDKVAARAQAEGLSVERFAQQAVEEAAEPKPKFAWKLLESGPYTPEEAGRNIRQLRKVNTLGGLMIKDLINDGR